MGALRLRLPHIHLLPQTRGARRDARRVRAPGRQITQTFTVIARWRKPIGSLRSAMERCHVLRVFVGPARLIPCVRRECNSVCARGLLLREYLPYYSTFLSGEPIIEKVFSYWIYFLARLPALSGLVGWGLAAATATHVA